MTKKTSWETSVDQALNRIKAQNKDIFPDVSSPDRIIAFLEAEELLSSIELGIGQMDGNTDELKSVYEHLRKEYSEVD
ncbi:MAG: hypothetical protein HQK62_10770 [Desulfamplus sp.]|nr:hypothetical protein [Desulfamplus sp.]